MASNALRRTPTAKPNIPNEGARGNCQHYPTIIRHKQQHDKEAVKHLHGVERSLHQPDLLLPHIRTLP